MKEGRKNQQNICDIATEKQSPPTFPLLFFFPFFLIIPVFLGSDIGCWQLMFFHFFSHLFTLDFQEGFVVCRLPDWRGKCYNGHYR